MFWSESKKRELVRYGKEAKRTVYRHVALGSMFACPPASSGTALLDICGVNIPRWLQLSLAASYDEEGHQGP